MRAEDVRAVDQGPGAPTPGSGLSSSVVALLLGIVLAVLVSKAFGAVGWGGDVASQAAGAASGSAPLLIDGARQRRAAPQQVPLTAWLQVARRWSPLLVSSTFAFAVMLVESVFGLVMIRTTRYVIKVSGGDPGRFSAAYLLVGGVVVLPVIAVTIVLFAVAAAHRLPPTHKRWFAFAALLYVVVRGAMLVARPVRAGELGVDLHPAVLAVALLLTAGLVYAVSVAGGWWGKRSQLSYTAAANFRRLSPDDQRAALSLLAQEPTTAAPASPSTRARDSA